MNNSSFTYNKEDIIFTAKRGNIIYLLPIISFIISFISLPSTDYQIFFIPIHIIWITILYFTQRKPVIRISQWNITFKVDYMPHKLSVFQIRKITVKDDFISRLFNCGNVEIEDFRGRKYLIKDIYNPSGIKYNLINNHAKPLVGWKFISSSIRRY